VLSQELVQRQTKRWSRTEECVISFHFLLTTVASGCDHQHINELFVSEEQEHYQDFSTSGSQRSSVSLSNNVFVNRLKSSEFAVSMSSEMGSCPPNIVRRLGCPFAYCLTPAC
jgi:hypothetical protein